MESQVNIEAIMKEMRDTCANLIQENAILKAHTNQLSEQLAKLQGTTETAKP